MVITPQIHEKLKFLLFDNYRYKGVRGGRGGGKSYSFADAALTYLLSEKTTVTVCRELKDSIKESVHKLIKERIYYHELDNFCTITDNDITFLNGSQINYKHLHNNIAEIKGLQNTNIAWIFEAESLTKESWDILYPTIIRNRIGQIWVEWNPANDDDFVMQRFVYTDDPDTKTVEINYTDNTMCPQALIDEAEKCKRTSPEDYAHIWMGKPSSVGERVYPTFDQNVHVRDYNVEKLKNNVNFFMGQDPATVYYPFAVWIARVRKTDTEFDYIVYNEFPTIDMMNGKYFHEIRRSRVCSLTLKQRATMFRVLDNTIDQTYNWIDILGRAIDTRFVKASGAASTTLNTRGLIHTMADPSNGGMAFSTPPESRIDTQRDNLRELLHYDSDLGLIRGFNEPHFFVMSHCHNVIDALKHHRVDLRKKVEDEKRKDPIDAIRITMALMEDVPHKSNTKPAVIMEQDNIESLKNVWLNNR